MIIPIEELQAETLNTIIEEFVLQEGTDYGEAEVPIAHKVQQVLMQLQRGDALLMYSELHETVNIISKDQLALHQQQDINPED